MWRREPAIDRRPTKPGGARAAQGWVPDQDSQSTFQSPSLVTRVIRPTIGAPSIGLAARSSRAAEPPSGPKVVPTISIEAGRGAAMSSRSIARISAGPASILARDARRSCRAMASASFACMAAAYRS